jgi:hypothetical protein
MADNNENSVPVVVQPPAAGAVLPQWAVVLTAVLTAVAGVLVSLPGLPPLVTGVASAVVAIGAALGIASPGIRRHVEPPNPRVGPPAP